MKKAKSIESVEFFDLIKDGSYVADTKHDGSPLRCTTFYVKHSGGDQAWFVKNTRQYCFVKVETKTKITLIVIDIDGEIAVFVKRKNKKN
jgi:hypothetical protein